MTTIEGIADCHTEAGYLALCAKLKAEGRDRVRALPMPALDHAIAAVQASAVAHCERMNEDREGDRRAFMCTHRLPDRDRSRAYGFQLPKLREPARV